MKKYLWQTMTLLLAVALFIMAYKDVFVDKKGVEGDAIKAQSAEEVIIDNIMTRSSVRKYLDKAIEEDKVEKVLRAGMAAPSAGNKQPWAIVVVKDKELLARLGEQLPYAKMTSGADIAFVVCGDLSKGFEGKESEYWIQDCSAVSENILLAAHALGLGAVWTGVYPMQERMEIVSTELRLPKNLIPLNVIPMGYPDGSTPVKDKWNPGIVYYNTVE